MPNPQNIEPHKFKKGQTGNPKGRPPKLFSRLITELQEAGYERVSANMIVEGYEYLLSLDEVKIKAIVEDKEQPMSLRIIARAMLGKDGYEILEKMLDRAHGKAKQKLEANIHVEQPLFPDE